MVYRTVQMHDGDIEVQSTPGAGTTFRLLLAPGLTCMQRFLAGMRSQWLARAWWCALVPLLAGRARARRRR